MKFSILVPVYNVEKHLEQCVDSLLDQTYTGDYEIILVDDGSTDSSGRICDAYAAKNPDKVKIIHKENGGHTSARLEAVRNASGEYSLFCDSDDFVEPNLLETVENTLNNNPDTDMVMYSFSYYEDGIRTPRNISVWNGTESFEGNGKKKLYELLITTPYLNSLCIKSVRTVYLKNDPTDYSILKDKDIAEDAYIVSYFLTVCKKIVNVNEPLYNYRTNRKSISRSYNSQKIERKNILFFYKRLIDLLPEWNMNSQEVINKILSSCFDNAMYLFRRHYEYAPNRKERKFVLDYNWNSMLFDEIIASPHNFGNQITVKLYKMLLSKKYLSLKIWFARNKIYNSIKAFKRKLKGAIKLK